MNRRALAYLLCCTMALTWLVVRLQGQAKSEQEPTKAITEKEIEALVKQLRDEDFNKREAARKSLTNIGPQAVPALYAARMASTDQELLVRLKEIISVHQTISKLALEKVGGDVHVINAEPNKITKTIV